MGMVKELAMDISYALGLDGDINEEVSYMTQRIINNHLERNKTKQGLESLRIGRYFRMLRDGIKWQKSFDPRSMVGGA